MRIITGEYRGRKLETPIGYDVRPTSDKVKEAVFNVLMNETYGRICVDLFAGTGSLGLEALSRGAARCYFCDNSRDSIKIIKENIRRCGAEDKSVVKAGDYAKALGAIKEQADIFFIDPPYKAGLYEKCIGLIDSLDLLSKEGIILAEHDARDEVPDRAGDLVKVREKKYGKTMISFYRHSDWSAEEEI
jgi:RNA methyltransferase, RsmD family